MSLPSTLRTACIQETCDLLISGVWEECEQNPFSYMPISLVQELLSCMWARKTPMRESHLLLTSGRLEHVPQPPAGNSGRVIGIVPLLRMLSLGCQNLRTLSIPKYRYPDRLDARQALHDVLPKCTKLEHLECCIYFEPNDLRNCVNLKTLRLHFDSTRTEMFCSRLTSDLLKRFRSAEVFDLCHYMHTFEDGEDLRVVRRILENCPQVASVGILESSLALKALHDRELGTLVTPLQFHLRKCYWNTESRLLLWHEYCDLIRVAALSCPLVKDLTIEVRYAGCLQYLRVLGNLRSLFLNFDYCEDDYGQECSSLLGYIGPQLTHLTIHSGNEYEDRKMPSVDVIYGNCPNLITLELIEPVGAVEGVQPCTNWLHLQWLDVTRPDRQSLFFLLSRCLHLKMLCLGDCSHLDDGIMQAILRKNSFAELEVALFSGCSLSEWGWRLFLQSASKLTVCFLRSQLLGEVEAMRCVRDLNPGAVCHPEEDILRIRLLFFPQRPYRSLY